MQATDTDWSSIEIAGYTEIEPIGQGGIGAVYRATRASTGVAVAVKVLRDLSDESVAWHRMQRELTALVALTGHANVIHVFELLELPVGPALVMEYAPGGSVADLLARRHGVLTVGEVMLVGRHTAAALVAAHAQGIVHRDIKPQNLLIDAYGQVKLCDFGIASLTRTEGFGTRTSAWSMRYTSPEDLDDDAAVGPASDVYSLGATLLHLARGAPPTLRDRLTEWVAPPTDDPQLAALDEVLAGCLHPRPGERPSAGDLVDRFERMSWTLSDRRRSLDFDTRTRFALSPLPVRAQPEGDDRSLESMLFGPGRPRPLDVPDADETLHRNVRNIPPRPPVASPARPRWPRTTAVLGVVAVIAAAVVWARPSAGSLRDILAQPGATAGAVPATVWAPAATSASTPASRTASTPASTTTSTTGTPLAAGVVPVTGLGHRSGDVSSLPLPAGTVPPALFDVVGRPPGLAAIDDPAVTWPFGDVGECLAQLAAGPALQVVSCDEPHDLQRYAAAELDPDALPVAFDPELVRSAVDTACASALEQFAAGDQPVLDVPVTRPSAASWQQGDRRYQCLVGIAQRRIVGDALR